MALFLFHMQCTLDVKSKLAFHKSCDAYSFSNFFYFFSFDFAIYVLSEFFGSVQNAKRTVLIEILGWSSRKIKTFPFCLLQPHFFVSFRVVFKGVEHYVYIKIYENWRIVELPWDSPYTWYLTLLGVDLGYYWVHRACHGTYVWKYIYSREYVNVTNFRLICHLNL